VTNVILLDQQMRQSDAEYPQIVQDLHRGFFPKHPWKVLQSGRVPEGGTIGPDWQAAPMVVTQNPVRAAVNFHHVVAEGQRLRRPVMVVAAKDEEHTAAGDVVPIELCLDYLCSEKKNGCISRGWTLPSRLRLQVKEWS